jgi:hypothetical protein
MKSFNEALRQYWQNLDFEVSLELCAFSFDFVPGFPNMPWRSKNGINA